MTPFCSAIRSRGPCGTSSRTIWVRTSWVCANWASSRQIAEDERGDGDRGAGELVAVRRVALEADRHGKADHRHEIEEEGGVRGADAVHALVPGEHGDHRAGDDDVERLPGERAVGVEAGAAG